MLNLNDTSKIQKIKNLLDLIACEVCAISVALIIDCLVFANYFASYASLISIISSLVVLSIASIVLRKIYLEKFVYDKAAKVKENHVFNIINVILLVIISVICFLPFLNVISVASSSPGYDINFTPKGFTLFNFETVFKDLAFWRAMGVSFFVVIVGTILSVTVMFSAAYALSKKDFPCRRGIMVFFIITMIFSGGIVPNVMLIRELGLDGTPWALIFPSVVQVYNLILIRSYLEGLPAELEESAGIDGANSLQTMFRVLLPVSMPCVASVSLFTAVSLWNNYTSALLYLGTEEKWYPLSLYILNKIQTDPNVLDITKEAIHDANIDSAMIVVSIIPILLVYPFVLKYFTKGVTVGAVKG